MKNNCNNYIFHDLVNCESINYFSTIILSKCQIRLQRHDLLKLLTLGYTISIMAKKLTRIRHINLLFLVNYK